MADAFALLCDRLLPSGRSFQDRCFASWDPADGTTMWLSSSLVVGEHWLNQRQISVPRVAVVWLVRGSGAIRWADGSWQPIAHGGGFVRLPGAVHSVRIDAGDPVAFWTASLPPGAADLLVGTGLVRGPEALLAPCRDPDLLRRVGEVHAAVRRAHDLPQAQLEVLALVQDLLRHQRRPSPEDVLARWLADPAERRGLPVLAEALHLSPSRLRHRFADRFGLSPEAWRRRERLRLAHRLLSQGGTTTAAVAQACGWSGARALAKAFRAAFGYPPSACRVERS